MSIGSHGAEIKAILSLVMLSLMLVQPVLGQTTYTLTVKTDTSSYTASQSIVVSGSVSPAPGSSNSPSGATIRIRNPSGMMVAIGDAPVDSATGNFQYTFVAGGSSAWVAGAYTVNATWGASPPTIFKTTTFTYSPPATTTSTSSSASTSTTTTSTSTSHTTSSTTSSSTSIPSSSTSSSTSIATSTFTASSPSPSSTTSSSGGGIPEFPVQPLVVLAFTIMIAALYLYTRQSAKKKIR